MLKVCKSRLRILGKSQMPVAVQGSVLKVPHAAPAISQKPVSICAGSA
jgi:hypothetical protein